MSNIKGHVYSDCGNTDNEDLKNTPQEFSTQCCSTAKGSTEASSFALEGTCSNGEMNTIEIETALGDERKPAKSNDLMLHNNGCHCQSEITDHINLMTRKLGTAQGFDFGLLPHVVLLNIFSYLDIKDRGRLACVSKHLLESSYDPSLWRKLDLNNRRLVNDRVLNKLASISSYITYLDVSECMSCSELGLQTALQNCHLLHTLRTIRCTSMTDSCLSVVGQICHHLKVINLSMCSITDKGIEMLCRGCISLEEINLNQCRYITSTSLIHIATYCKNVINVIAEHNTKIHDDGVSELVTECHKLKRLQLNSCGITGQSGRNIASFCPNMKILDVRYCTTLNNDIVKEIVCGCPNLELLNLSLCFNVTDVSAGHIVSHCTKLVSLYLVHCRITDEGLRILSVNGFGLEKLDVSWCQEITDTGVKTLVEGCKTLKHLGLVRCDQVSDEVITELSLGYPTIFLSTFMTEVNRMFRKAGLPEAMPQPPPPH